MILKTIQKISKKIEVINPFLDLKFMRKKFKNQIR